jgi:hypothetical protein
MTREAGFCNDEGLKKLCCKTMNCLPTSHRAFQTIIAAEEEHLKREKSSSIRCRFQKASALPKTYSRVKPHVARTSKRI